MNDIDKLRQRWTRWLGQKTRRDKPYWVTLLDSNWSSWLSKVLEKHEFIKYRVVLPYISTREEVKHLYSEAIKCADMHDLLELDELYCRDKIDL